MVTMAVNKPEEEPPVAKKNRIRRARSSDEENGARSPQPVHYGTLEVNVRPWANVEIDGVEQGTTPLKAHKLEAGSHKVVLQNHQLGYEETVLIRIKSGQITTVNRGINQ